jgi:glucose-6-phosphate 1-dehydrogenase
VDNWRWAGVPFFLRTGSECGRVSEIALHLQPVPPILFQHDRQKLEPDVLMIRIQPDEGLRCGSNREVPGPSVNIEPVNMNFPIRTFLAAARLQRRERFFSTSYGRRDALHATRSGRGVVELNYAILGDGVSSPRSRQRTRRAPGAAESIG